MSDKSLVLVNKADAVFDALIEGRPLREALKKAQVNPREWVKALHDHPELSDKFNQLKVLYSDLMVTEILDIADDVRVDPVRASNMIRARQWLASKWNQKQYGDKLDVQVVQKVDIGAALQDARERAKAIDVKAEAVDAEIVSDEGVVDGDLAEGESV